MPGYAMLDTATFEDLGGAAHLDANDLPHPARGSSLAMWRERQERM